MRCTQHRKEFQGACNWCGSKLCELCVAKQEGKKVYCETCAVRLVPFVREKLPAPRQMTRPMTATTAPAPQAAESGAVKRRFVLGKDGYFELR